MKRDAVVSGKASRQWACPDPEFGKLYPALAAQFCDCYWDDGKPRDPCSLSIRFSDRVFLSIVDAENSRSAFTTADNLQEGLAALEALFAAGTPPWRRWKGKK